MTQTIIDCPALHARAKDYPTRFRGRVPKMIRMLRTVEPDALVFYSHTQYWQGVIATACERYSAWTNSHGAVCAVMPDGRRLGVKPDEFEVVEWHS